MTKGSKNSLNSVLSEIERLREENKGLHETIKNVSFNDNPDIFCIRRDSQNFFPRVTVKEARMLLASERQDMKINIGWEIIE